MGSSVIEALNDCEKSNLNRLSIVNKRILLQIDKNIFINHKTGLFWV
jgi:hypothetical protein